MKRESELSNKKILETLYRAKRSDLATSESLTLKPTRKSTCLSQPLRERR